MQKYPIQNYKYSKSISTKKIQVQSLFDTALHLAYGFNHQQAIYCCKKALELQQHPMLYWLISFSQGINYNNCDQQLPHTIFKSQFISWQKADQIKDKASPFQQKLINALKFRVGDGKSGVHKQNDKAFGQAMRKIYYQNEQKKDAFLCCLTAQALMDLSPWNLWCQKDNEQYKYGQPHQNTLQIKAILKKGLEINQQHIGLRHLWIHLNQLSINPQVALDSNFNKRLDQICPSLGHLCHMPSHIQILCGNYTKSMELNKKGIIADEQYLKYRAQTGRDSICFYTVYICHNLHFYVYSAMLAAHFQQAYQTALKLTQLCDRNLLQDTSVFKPNGSFYLQGFVVIPLHVLIRFGKWQEILSQPFGPFLQVQQIYGHDETYKASIAFLHYGKGVAFSVLGGKQKDDHKREQFLKKAMIQTQKFQIAIQNVPKDKKLFNNTLYSLLKIYRYILLGEFNYAKRNYETAFLNLRQAVCNYDTLPYDEPWGIMQPTRHILAALLLQHGKLTENIKQIEQAIFLYKKDLGLEGGQRSVHHPNNIWSLTGLRESYKSLGQVYGKKVQQIKKFSDVKIQASCYCSNKLN